jgi:hypothetical protein
MAGIPLMKAAPGTGARRPAGAFEPLPAVQILACKTSAVGDKWHF